MMTRRPCRFGTPTLEAKEISDKLPSLGLLVAQTPALDELRRCRSGSLRWVWGPCWHLPDWSRVCSLTLPVEMCLHVVTATAQSYLVGFGLLRDLPRDLPELTLLPGFGC